MKLILISALFLACFVASVSAQDLDWYYAQLSSLENQFSGLQTQYNREKQTNDQRLTRIEKAKANKDAQAAENELKDAYVSAERLEQLNGRMNSKQIELDAMCSEWSKVYGPTVDQLLAEAEKSNSKKRGEIGVRLQKYQTLNSRLCVKSPNPIPSEWRSLRIEPYDGPQEINQKVQLLKEISREMSIGISRLEQQYQQASREKLMRERAQEFVDEGTLFEGGVAIRSHAKGGTSVETDGGNTPMVSSPDTAKTAEPDEVSTGVIPMGTSWDLPSTEEGYKKQRSELLKQQDELRNKIKEFEEKEKALLKP